MAELRLTVIDAGQAAIPRRFFHALERLGGSPVDPVLKVATLLPRSFGRPFFDVVHGALEGPSFWTTAEREYLAAFTSDRNRCPFCAEVHGTVAQLESRRRERRRGGHRPELQAVLPLLEKVSVGAPEDLTPSDIDVVRAAGVPDDAIIDALAVNFVFNLINRLANAMGFDWESERHAKQGARVLHHARYRIPRFVLPRD